ncbi:S8 family serine peptidase [Almyronema epifaneia]|uniref:S8 family serine peptidase n=1 Tax=Almyronema epifaneia S1 TaxID=2991925 RepID=A0ABW6ID77_9CYAN
MSRQVDLVLQRGGEELLLVKLSDRFTTAALTATEQAALQAQINPEAVRTIASGRLLEWQVLPRQLETAMATVRQSPAVEFASHVYRLLASPQTLVYLAPEMTIQFTPEAGPAVIEAAAIAYGLQQQQAVDGIANTFVFRLTSAAVENPVKIANRLAEQPQVLLAEPNIIIQTELLYRPQDPLYARQWHLFHTGSSQSLAANSHIAAESAWELTRGSRSVVIAVADDGFDVDHPDFQGVGKLVAPQDLKQQDALPTPTREDENHGTAVAGLAIAEENGIGVVGVAPGCAFMPIQTTGFLDDESIEQLFDWAIEQGAAVISASWSPAAIYFPLSLRQRNAITKAATQGRYGRGCVIVFSAGNANRPVSGSLNEQGWPKNAVKGATTWLSGFAVHPDVISVAASTSLNRKAAYSNWGQHIAIAAPSNNAPPSMALPRLGTLATGPEIQTALPGLGMVTSDRSDAAGYATGAYTTGFGGTSSACPVVAGVAALVLSVNPYLKAYEVRRLLQETADKIVDTSSDPQLGLRYGTYDDKGHSFWFGYGKVNAARAVQEAQRRLHTSRRLQQTLRQSNPVPLSIPDDQPQGATSRISIGDRGRLQDIEIRLSLTHEFLGDISLTLISPEGTTVLLQGRTLGRQRQLNQTYTLATTPTLANLLYQSVTGQWLLKAIDHSPLNTGQLNRWELILGVAN